MGLVGIARLARDAPSLLEKRSVEYRELPSFQILNRCDSPRVPFEWTINPYRGCEIGCRYCYARYTHEFMEFRDPWQFEKLIFAKQFDPATFRTALRKMNPREQIALGTATDPYQAAERRYFVTRKILSILNEFTGRSVGITTKSDLIARDLDLLVSIGSRNRLTVAITITTVETELARRIEPRAPRPDLRLETIRRLAAAGISVGVSCSPVMPLINDSDAQLEDVARAASEAGAKWLFARALFLTSGPRRVFFAFLAEHFPHLMADYRRGIQPDRLPERMQRIKAKYSLAGRLPEWAPPELQLSLLL